MLKELLNIQKGITCVIGSGGKTTLIRKLAQELAAHGTVVVTTTTHIFPEPKLPLAITPQELIRLLSCHRVICAGTPAEQGKLTALPMDGNALRQAADYILVEADGSKGLPMKAHMPHEPVLLPERNLTICVMGASGFGEPICHCAHRPELFASRCGSSVTDIVTPQRAAQVVEREALADLMVVNQVHTVEEYELAVQFAKHISRPVFAGSLQKGIFQCLF